MKFYSRRIIKPGDLNPSLNLFGGTLLSWIDEEAAIYAMCQLGSNQLVTRYMSEINFVAPGKAGDVLEFGLETAGVGKTSITVRCEVRNKQSRDIIIRVNEIVFVNIDADGRAVPHGLGEEQMKAVGR